MVLLQADKLVSTSKSPFLNSIVPTLRQLHTSLAQTTSFLRTLYLFTKNNFLTFAIPTTLFAAFGALSGPILTTNASPNLFHILLRIPSTLFIVWAKLLILDISGQRSPSAVEEDKINKPHRPLPSGRITMEGARRLLFWGIPVVLLLSWALGCWEEALLLFTSLWMYNDLQGSDEYWILRNFFIALGYGLFSCSALRVMVGSEHALNAKAVQWVGLVIFVMFVTQHICDIKDAEGDRMRGRRSAPIVLGDNITRWTVAVPIVFCSIACPLFFRVGPWSYLLTLPLGALVAGRTLAYRQLKADMLTWKLWALWTCMVFALPVAKNPVALLQAWDALTTVLCPGGECTSSLNLVAVSSVALVVEGRRLYGSVSGTMGASNITVPDIVVEGVTS